MTALQPPDKLRTRRLLLRMPRLADARPLFEAYASDPDIPRFMTWVAHSEAAQTQEFLASRIAEWERGVNFEYVMEHLDEPGVPVGMIGLHPGPARVNFGYVLARPHWGRGLMPEALAALVEWSLAQPSVFRAQAYCDVDNPASARVMEKAGMSLEGIVRRYSLHPNVSDAPRDCVMYAKVR